MAKNKSGVEYVGKMDKECIRLCDAMNSVSSQIYTIESCCGHGKDEFRIWFVCKNLRVLPKLIYWFDGCHSGVYGWRVIVKTDCGMNPVHFRVESEEKGEQAYREADLIAECIEKYVNG